MNENSIFLLIGVNLQMFIKSLKNRVRIIKSKMLSVLAPTILFTSIIFLFGPFIIYSGNMSEFQVGLFDILKYYVIPSLFIAAILITIGGLLSKNFLSLFVSVILTTGVLLWIQGNFFVWKNGPIGITDIDWTKNAWHGWVNGILWITLLVFALKFHRIISKFAVLVSVVLISVQVAYLVVIGLKNPELLKGTQKSYLSISPPENIFRFSKKLNIIHIILDEFQSTVFKDIIDKDPEYYKNVLDGFTFFEKTTGSFPTTLMSIPAFMGETNYKNDVPIDNFIDTVYKGKTISNILAAHGYEVDIVTPVGWYCAGKYSSCYQIPVPYGVSKQKHDQANAVILLNLVLFRYAPDFLKRVVMNNQMQLHNIYLSNQDRQHWEGARHYAHKMFLKDLIDKMSVMRNEPVYKLIHLTTTHWPAALNRDCQYTGKILPWTWDNIKVQTKCSFDDFLGLIDKIKHLGIYESSFIILHADHGYWKIPDSAKQIKLNNEKKHLDGYFLDDNEYFAQIVCSALPLLAIKRPYGEGPLVISEVEADITDLPATISSVLKLGEKFNGRSVFDIDRNLERKRSFFYYDKLNRPGDEYFDRMDEFVIEGSVFDKNSWKFIQHILPPHNYETSKIDFGTTESSRFLRSGWSYNDVNSEGSLKYQWALGRSASIYISLDKNERVRLTSNIKNFLKDQQITVKVDGKEVGNWSISSNWEWEKHSIIIHADKNRTNVSVVEFTFSQFKPPTGKESRPLSVLFESITLQKLESN